MKIKMDNHEMSNKELTELSLENVLKISADNIRLTALVALLEKKGLISDGEFKEACGAVFNGIQQFASVNGLDFDKYEEAIKDELGL